MYYYHVENCDTSWVTVSLSCRCRKLFVPGTYPAYMERWFYGRRQDEDGREGSRLYRLKCELATFRNASSPEHAPAARAWWRATGACWRPGIRKRHPAVLSLSATVQGGYLIPVSVHVCR